MDPDHAAVAGEQPVLALERLPGLVHGREICENALAIVGMEHPAEEAGVADPFLARVADEIDDLRAHVHRALFVEPLEVAGERKLLDERAVPLLQLANPFTRVLHGIAVPEVPADPDDVRGPPVCIAKDVGRRRPSADPPVGEDDAELDLVAGRGLGASHEGFPHPGDVVGVDVLEVGVERAAEALRHEPVQRVLVTHPLDLAGLEVPGPGAQVRDSQRQPEPLVADFREAVVPEFGIVEMRQMPHPLVIGAREGRA